MNWEIITFLGYFVILLGVALIFYFNGSNKNSEDFFLGGRSMGPWVTALSAQASDMSAWLLMGLPGSILAFGFGQMWIGIGLALGTAANWILCAKRLRTFSKAADDAITVPQYLTNRFGVDSRTLQLVCALISCLPIPSMWPLPWLPAPPCSIRCFRRSPPRSPCWCSC